MSNLNFVIGVQTRISFSIMPDELLALPTLTAPQDVAIAVAAAILATTAGAATATLAVTALTGPVPSGTPIDLSVGTGANIKTLTIFTAAHARTGDTNLIVEPITLAQIKRAMKDPAATTFTANSAGTYIAKLRLQGGTNSQKNIQNQNTETRVYGEGLTFQTGIITSASWNLSYDYNVLPLDPGFYRLNYATVNAIAGVHGYVWFEDPAPVSYTNGNGTEGLVQIENIQQSNPADGIITGQSNILGRGTPKFTPYS